MNDEMVPEYHSSSFGQNILTLFPTISWPAVASSAPLLGFLGAGGSIIFGAFAIGDDTVDGAELISTAAGAGPFLKNENRLDCPFGTGFAAIFESKLNDANRDILFGKSCSNAQQILINCIIQIIFYLFLFCGTA